MYIGKDLTCVSTHLAFLDQKYSHNVKFCLSSNSADMKTSGAKDGVRIHCIKVSMPSGLSVSLNSRRRKDVMGGPTQNIVQNMYYFRAVQGVRVRLFWGLCVNFSINLLLVIIRLTVLNRNIYSVATFKAKLYC